MTATYQEALDILMGMFNTKWDADTAAVVGYIPEVVWPGLEPVPSTIPTEKFWARFSQQTVDDEQSNLNGSDASRRYTITGVLFIQIFAPLSNSEGVEKARKLAVIARDAYRGQQTTSRIFIRNARINEIGSEDKWYRINVIVNFEHDDIA